MIVFFSLARYSGRGRGEGLFSRIRKALTLTLSRSTGRGKMQRSSHDNKRRDSRTRFTHQARMDDVVAGNAAIPGALGADRAARDPLTRRAWSGEALGRHGGASPGAAGLRSHSRGRALAAAEQGP